MLMSPSTVSDCLLLLLHQSLPGKMADMSCLFKRIYIHFLSYYCILSPWLTKQTVTKELNRWERENHYIDIALEQVDHKNRTKLWFEEKGTGKSLPLSLCACMGVCPQISGCIVDLCACKAVVDSEIIKVAKKKKRDTKMLTTLLITVYCLLVVVACHTDTEFQLIFPFGAAFIRRTCWQTGKYGNFLVK